MFPYLPQQPGYNKRLRRLADTLRWLIGMLARDTRLWADDVWVVDSVRHEAPWIRVEVRDLHRRVVAAARLELRAV
jgi:hypothetical protein